MQHIITRNDVAIYNVSIRHSMINVFGTHLQGICHIAYTEDYKVKGLKVHTLLFGSKITNKL